MGRCKAPAGMSPAAPVPVVWGLVLKGVGCAIQTLRYLNSVANNIAQKTCKRENQDASKIHQTF